MLFQSLSPEQPCSLVCHVSSQRKHMTRRSVCGWSLRSWLHRLVFILVLASGTLLSAGFTPVTRADIHIYQDADNSHYRDSALAIQLGMELAFSEVGNTIQGHAVNLVFRDHRGNVVRSKRNYQTFVDDPQALAIFSGIHSPPLIKNREFINTSRALTLVPWAAGGPITRFPSSDNWVFRLSVDDTRAGPFLIEYAINKRNCRRPHLVLEQTPWGDSNLRSMSAALLSLGADPSRISRFGLGLGAQGAHTLVRSVADMGSDCVLLVANGVEGAAIVNEIARLPDDRRASVISHWGILAGQFHYLVSAQNRERVNLRFIQTCFAFTNGSFASKRQEEIAEKVFSGLVKYTNGVIEHPSDLNAAVGFVHAYDLTRILIQGLQQIDITGNKATDQLALRQALESLDTPVSGLIKTYKQPFSQYHNERNRDAHEALDSEDYCMARFGPDNDVLIDSD